MKPTNDMNAARGKTAATPAATAHPPGLKAPRTAAYRGERIKINSLGGTTTTYIPLMYLAAEWSLDYRTLRNFVRDNTNIPTEKQAFHHDFRGQKTDFIVIREAGLKEYEIELKGKYRLTPELTGSIKAMDGVVDARLS